MATHRAKHGVSKKPLTALLAVVLALGIVFSGTFAWQSISQEALNEVTGSVNPGGRLHDEFYDITGADDLTRQYDKNVFVENFTSLVNNGVQIYARVRLDEYMEIGPNAGKEDSTNEAKSLVDGAVLEDKSTWTTHIFGQDDVFHEYWNWELDGGRAVYMPTFNKNKDSLEADINGTFDAGFLDHVGYAPGDLATGNAIYDADTKADGTEEDDELKGFDLNGIIDGTVALPEDWVPRYVRLVPEEHTARETGDSFIMPMADYLARLNNDIPTDDTGDFWVYDADGWAYWAKPIDPDTATGLLLDGISRTETIINQDWYYGINVVAQFITADDLGQDDSTGFYDIAEGLPPSDEALLLLNAIGVDVTFDVGDETELAEALRHGGTVQLTNDVHVSAPLVVSEDTVLELGGHSIFHSGDGDIFSEDNRTWSLISAQGEETTLTINGGRFIAKENDSFCVDVRDGAKVIINDGEFRGNISAVYVHSGEAVINGGTYSIMQIHNLGGNGYDQLLNCYDENYRNGTARISVFGGTFYDFDPAASNDGSLVPGGYSSIGSADGNTSIYVVSRNGG